MRLQMYLKIALDGKLSMTVWTLEGFLPGVNPLVLHQLGWIAEGLHTEATAERLLEPRLGGVVPVGEVNPQVAHRLESLRAQMTHKFSTLKN